MCACGTHLDISLQVPRVKISDSCKFRVLYISFKVRRSEAPVAVDHYLSPSLPTSLFLLTYDKPRANNVLRFLPPRHFLHRLRGQPLLHCLQGRGLLLLHCLQGRGLLLLHCLQGRGLLLLHCLQGRGLLLLHCLHGLLRQFYPFNAGPFPLTCLYTSNRVGYV